MTNYILGISAYYHDSAACILADGQILCAAQQERFSRVKHDERFPVDAIKYCLDHAGISLKDLSHIAFYDKPLLKFERILDTFLCTVPFGLGNFIKFMPMWIKEKLFLKNQIRSELCSGFGLKKADLPPLLFSEHHQSHAASAFYASPYEKAAVLCMDGVGEWATTSLWQGEGNKLEKLWEIKFPHSIGLLYSSFTQYLGFKVNSGEYKVMGLAPYGVPRFSELILKHIVELKDDGSFWLDMSYFSYLSGQTMISKKFEDLFGSPVRAPEGELTQFHMDVAASIQEVTEQIVLKLALSAKKETGTDYLCLAGGVALNCVANGLVEKSSAYKGVWIQPAAGDAGGSLGAALATYYSHLKNNRLTCTGLDHQRGSYLGPEYSSDHIRVLLEQREVNFSEHTGPDLYELVASHLSEEKVVGWFSGRMEFGPRALGNRSILGDARSSQMQKTLNLKIKFRESFRPFAPAVIAEDCADYFDLTCHSPYMLKVGNVSKQQLLELSNEDAERTGLDQLQVVRSKVPAITHVNNSARVQTVHEETNPHFYALLKEFKKKTNCSVLINTSFNVRGEPIVCTPADALKCFFNTDMDYLVLEQFVISKEGQKHNFRDEEYRKRIGGD
jgi:carbamoyltransferase